MPAYLATHARADVRSPRSADFVGVTLPGAPAGTEPSRARRPGSRLCELLHGAAVAVHDVEVAIAGVLPVAHEDDGSAVRRPSGKRVECGVRGEPSQQKAVVRRIDLRLRSRLLTKVTSSPFGDQLGSKSSARLLVRFSSGEPSNLMRRSRGCRCACS